MQLTRNSILFCLVGPAGSGKTSLAKKLIEASNSNLQKIISATSRAPRPGEVDGINYKFMSRPQFEQAVAKGEFFESEEIHGNLYGQLKSSIEQAVQGSTDVIFDIDIRGAESIETKYPKETVVIFLLPPNKQALKERILARAPTSPEELDKRMLTAQKELESFNKVYKSGTLIDYALVNLDFEDTLKKLSTIIEAERSRLSRVKPEVIKSLLE